MFIYKKFNLNIDNYLLKLIFPTMYSSAHRIINGIYKTKNLVNFRCGNTVILTYKKAI